MQNRRKMLMGWVLRSIYKRIRFWFVEWIEGRRGMRQNTKPAVVLVEDDKMIRDVASLMLEELGCRVTVCAHGKEALNFH